jgi:hypothetical protein
MMIELGSNNSRVALYRVPIWHIHTLDNRTRSYQGTLADLAIVQQRE